MNPQLQTYLPLLLFLPWFLILGALFWIYPRQPRNAKRRLFDAASLLFASGVFIVALQWAYAAADTGHGQMWKQVFATSVGYGLFLATLLLAFVLRRRWFRRTQVGNPSA